MYGVRSLAPAREVQGPVTGYDVAVSRRRHVRDEDQTPANAGDEETPTS